MHRAKQLFTYQIYFFYGCIGGLVLILLNFIFPVVFSPVHAETATARSSEKSQLSLSVPSYVNLEVLPAQNGVLSRQTAAIHIATNNESGYSLYLTTADESSALRSTNAKNSAVIPALEHNTTPENFPVNAWGFHLQSDDETASEFQPVPSQADEPLVQTGAASQDVYQLDYGVKVDASVPSGEYLNSVIISAVANPLAVTTLSSITYMQEIDGTICSNSAEHETKQLIDLRDGQSYWVAKMKDGNCWMTQNLAYTFDGTTALLSTSSDVATGSSFVGPQTQKVVPAAYASASYDTTRNWSLGRFVRRMPTDMTTCTAQGATNTHDAVLSGGTLADCTQVGFVDVSGEDWQPTFEAKTMEVNGEERLVALDEANKTYDAHYLTGNYYPFNAATAGTGGSLANRGADSSVCPKGWRLPFGNTAANGSFYNLLTQYGITTQVGGSTEHDDNAQGYNISKPPLYFTRQGQIDVRRGVLYAVSFGYYWTRTAGALAGSGNQSSTSHSLVFAASISDGTYRYMGLSVRCYVLAN